MAPFRQHCNGWLDRIRRRGVGSFSLSLKSNRISRSAVKGNLITVGANLTE